MGNCLCKCTNYKTNKDDVSDNLHQIDPNLNNINETKVIDDLIYNDDILIVENKNSINVSSKKSKVKNDIKKNIELRILNKESII